MGGIIGEFITPKTKLYGESNRFRRTLKLRGKLEDFELFLKSARLALEYIEYPFDERPERYLLDKFRPLRNEAVIKHDEFIVKWA